MPTAMVEHFSRRRSAIDARYAELERAYRDEHGREPDAGSARRLARQANLETREGKRPPAPLADKRAAWREELRSQVRRFESFWGHPGPDIEILSLTSAFSIFPCPPGHDVMRHNRTPDATF